jgi:gliding motility-associated-like protein
MRFVRFVVLLIFVLTAGSSFAQDVDLYLTGHYLAGKSVIKLCRDFDDPYMWILAKNNEVYRLNTVTKQLDDYTPKLNSISGYQIFDIAGLGANMVELAIKNANGTRLASYQNGTISYPLDNNFSNISGNILNIGPASSGTELLYGVSDSPDVMIATDQGFWRCSFPSSQLNYNGNTASRIYSSNYRDQLFIATSRIDGSGVNLIPALGSNYGVPYSFDGLLRSGVDYGGEASTACFTPNQVYRSASFFTPDIFWGNSSGMYQAKWRGQSPFLSPYKHYLDKVKINKICDIFGLIEFGNERAKENLLVGTDKGLYYSSSFLHAGEDPALDNFTLYHFDPLGNIPVNYVEVNNAGASYPPFCENGIWCATNDGIYLIKPDFAAHSNTGPLSNAIQFKDQDANISQTNICEGITTDIILNSEITANTIQWFKNGNAIINQNGTSLTVTTTGEYYAVLFDPCSGVSVQTNHLKVQVTSAPVFSFNYPDKLPFCDLSATTLKTDNNPGYQYRWYTDGVLNGTVTYNYIVTKSGKYKVEVSACTDNWVSSKEIEVDLVNLPVPVITADKPKYCAGETAVLTVNVPLDAGYQVNWYKNGGLISAGKDKTSIPVTTDGKYTVILSTIATCTQTSTPLPVTFTSGPVFTFNYPDRLSYCAGTPVNLKAEGSAVYQYQWYKDGILTGDVTQALSVLQTGKYKVEVSACDGSWVPSKEVQVDLIGISVPVISTDKPVYCVGDKAALSINLAADPGYTINWYKDNVLLTAATNQTAITSTLPGTYTVTVTSTLPNTDGSTCVQTSGAQSLSFDPPPSVTIQKIGMATLCDGQTVDLKVTYNTGTVKWSTGESSNKITISESGTYSASVTTAAGCSAGNSIDVQFFKKPVLNISNAGVCVPSHKTATLIAPPGMASYNWNDQPGTDTYIVDHQQTVTLTVKDANGCQATQQIQVSDECPDIKIPNAFTPNGDGVNDNWNITGLEYDPTALVRVFNRYGQQIYQSKGYGTAWNGEFKGKRLPAGAYYYIVNAKNGSLKFGGEVTIIY